MGHRLSAIATRTGDAGTTGLGDGSRVSKSDPRVAAMGDVDELNATLDVWLTQANATLPRLQEFIRPGGSLPAAQAHVCRTVCRRAERALVQLAESQAVSNAARQYLNRLSDLMFVLARVLNLAGGGTEHQWDRNRNPKEAS